MNEAIAENLYAGNAMTRRKSYTYGDLVPTSPYGQVDASIGKAVASGDVGILPPTRSIEQPIEELTIDGVRMVFQNTPGTEAPCGDEHLVSGPQGILGRGEHRRQPAQHAHAAGSTGA